MSVIESIIDIPAEHEKKIYGNFDENIKKIERTLHEIGRASCRERV